jgi:hypothetical protein
LELSIDERESVCISIRGIISADYHAGSG